jgi:hypothetical protein
MTRPLRYLWRLLTRRCQCCGAKRPRFNRNDVHTFGPNCRACNKSANFARLYGAGEKRIKLMLTTSSTTYVPSGRYWPWQQKGSKWHHKHR